MAALGLSLLTLPAAAQTIEMKMSHLFPSSHFTQTRMLQPWIDEVERRSNGRIKVTIFAAGSAFGDVTKQFDQVRAGVVDIATGLPGVPRGRHPRTILIELPFMVKSADAATRALMDIYPQHLAEDYPGVKVLSLTTTNSGSIHSRGKPVKELADLKGMRVRSPTPPLSAMIEFLGGTPVGLPPGQIYENLEKGTVDAVVMPWGPIGAFKLHEVTTSHLDVNAYTVSQYTVMNQRRYDSLPADLKKVIDDMSGKWFTDRWGKLWSDTDEEAKQIAIKRGNAVFPVSDELRNKWRKDFQPLIESYLAEQEKAGVKNIRGIFDALTKAIAKYES
jgi:TRAP-type C4-dicarboxylate transport system substrate-binding protein